MVGGGSERGAHGNVVAMTMKRNLLHYVHVSKHWAAGMGQGDCQFHEATEHALRAQAALPAEVQLAARKSSSSSMLVRSIRVVTRAVVMSGDDEGCW